MREQKALISLCGQRSRLEEEVGEMVKVQYVGEAGSLIGAIQISVSKAISTSCQPPQRPYFPCVLQVLRLKGSSHKVTITPDPACLCGQQLTSPTGSPMETKRWKQREKEAQQIQRTLGKSYQAAQTLTLP